MAVTVLTLYEFKMLSQYIYPLTFAFSYICQPLVKTLGFATFRTYSRTWKVWKKLQSFGELLLFSFSVSQTEAEIFFASIQ